MKTIAMVVFTFVLTLLVPTDEWNAQAGSSNGSVACGGQSSSCIRGSDGSVACGGQSSSCIRGSK